MAKPPEPIREILPRAALIVEAEVESVLSEGPRPPAVDAPDDHTSVPQEVASQRVALRVRRVLRGEAPADAATLEVTKPQGDYSLRAGNQGPFLLERIDGDWVILGRWGPDNYRLAWVEESIAAEG